MIGPTDRTGYIIFEAQSKMKMQDSLFTKY